MTPLPESPVVYTTGGFCETNAVSPTRRLAVIGADETTQPAVTTRLAPSTIPPHGVLLRRWSLLCDDARLRDLRRLLNQEELRRADKFVTDRLKRRFVAARAGLRNALGEATGRAAAEISFSYGPMGKPRLILGTADPPIHFNLTHSGENAVLAVSREPIGVDLEVLRPMSRAAAFAKRWFHAAEQDRYAGSSEADRLEVFFRIWTAKEAALKLLGKGVGEALPQLLTPEGDGWATDLPANDSGIRQAWITRADTSGAYTAIACAEKPVSIHS